jgi:hypothetical protein
MRAREFTLTEQDIMDLQRAEEATRDARTMKRLQGSPLVRDGAAGIGQPRPGRVQLASDDGLVAGLSSAGCGRAGLALARRECAQAQPGATGRPERPRECLSTGPGVVGSGARHRR